MGLTFDKNLDPNPKRTAKFRLVSRIIVLVTAAFWLVYDIFPAVNVGRGDTISENIRDWSRTVWVLPFFWGALTAHFFINFGQHPVAYKHLFYGFAGTTLLLIVVNLLTYFVWQVEVPLWGRLLALSCGVILGAILWGQNA